MYRAPWAETEDDPRRFGSVAAALSWYTAARLRRERQPLADAATFTALASCLAERSSDDLPFDVKVTPARLEALCWWYASDEPAASFKPEQHDGMGWAAFVDYCRATRNVIRRRLKARGLLTSLGPSATK